MSDCSSNLLTRTVRNDSIIINYPEDVCFIFFSLLPSVFYQPVSTACTNINLKSQQLLLNLSLNLKRLICGSCNNHRFPLGELPTSNLPLPHMSPGAVLALKCINNTLSQKSTCVNSRDSSKEETGQNLAQP